MAIIVAPAEAAWIAIKQIGAACCAPNAVNANSPRARHAAPVPKCQHVRARAAHHAPSTAGANATAPFNSISVSPPPMSAPPPIKRSQGSELCARLLKTLWNSTVAITAQRAATSKTIDKTIEDTAPAFPIEQMAAIERNILRLAIYELLIDNRVPMRAAINEAVELAKLFGGESSPRFVNGVLGSALDEVYRKL